MKKFAFFTLLSICLTAIAITSGNSRQKDVLPSATVTNITDTTPKTTHHTTTKKPASDTAVHKTTTVKKTTTSKTKKPVKDSTQKK